MNIDEFYLEIEKLVPIKRESEDFRSDLSKVLNTYSQMLKSIDREITNQFSNWTEIEERIDRLIVGIKGCIKKYYEGAHSSAFNILKNQIVGYQQLQGLLEVIELHTIEQGEYLWRGRMFDNNRSKTYEDMFHIPFEKRGIIRTQRYSTPGYPCLYLGTTIYACWEELGRPKFDDLMLSGFRTSKNIKLLDLRKPSKSEFENETLISVLLRLPLIIACSFIIQDEDNEAVFKPEYIIPQLLIEVIVNENSNNKKTKDFEELILGVIFTSTRINSDFDYQPSVFDNVAIPAIDTGSKGHCNILAEIFHLTNPTCYEYEEIRKLTGVIYLENELSHEEEIEQRYMRSKIGELEMKIKQMELHQFKYIIIPPKIIFPADGDTISIEVKSNTDWTIS